MPLERRILRATGKRKGLGFSPKPFLSVSDAFRDSPISSLDDGLPDFLQGDVFLLPRPHKLGSQVPGEEGDSVILDFGERNSDQTGREGRV